MDTKLRLGDFVFEGMEVPESLELGGEQRIVEHRYVGGAKTVQAMGQDNAPIAWRGLMLGGTALQRAAFLDSQRIAGKALQMSVFDRLYSVVIQSFKYTIERYYKVQYVIVCTVVEDQNQPVQTIAPTGFDAAIRNDSYSMLGLGDLIGDSTLSGLLDTLDSAIAQVDSFATAVTATIQPIINQIGEVTSRVSTLQASVENTLLNATTLGGVLPSNPLSASIANMAAQVSATTRYPLLLNVNSLAVRMSRNVSMANLQSSTRTVQVAGGTLYDVAASEYGDATLWPAIAKATGILDPLLVGIKTLRIPASPQDTGGVLAQ